MKQRFINYFIVFLLFIIMFLQMILSTLSDSPTNDEQVHLLAGLSYLHFRDLRVNPEHPPLTKLLSAVSVKIFYPELKFPYPNEQFANQIQWLQPIADSMFAQNDATKLLLAARLPMMFLTLCFGLILFLFLYKLVGKIFAFIALILFSFEPNLLGFGKLVITDNAVAGFLFVASIFLFLALKKISLRYWLGFCISFLLALLSKYTALFFIPIFFLSGTVYCLIKKYHFRQITKNALHYLATLLACFAGIWIFYSIFSPPSYFLHDKEPYKSIYTEVKPQWIVTFLRQSPFPYYYSYGVSYVFAQGYFGQKVYLLNRWGNHNWWWFYPVTFLLKTPLLYLLLFGLSLISGIKRKDKATFFFFFIFIFYLLLVSISPLAIGMRVILPLTYLMLMIIGVNLSYLLRMKNGSQFITIIIFISSITRIISYPNYISHINGLKYFFNKYDMMADTNYDWGQDIKRLALYFKEKRVDTIYFAADSAVRPELYGLTVKPVARNWEEPKPTGWIALSVSARNFPVNIKDYLGREGGAEHPYSWLDQYPIYHTIGDTILIYFVP